MRRTRAASSSAAPLPFYSVPYAKCRRGTDAAAAIAAFGLRHHCNCNAFKYEYETFQDVQNYHRGVVSVLPLQHQFLSEDAISEPIRSTCITVQSLLLIYHKGKLFSSYRNDMRWRLQQHLIRSCWSANPPPVNNMMCLMV